MAAALIGILVFGFLASVVLLWREYYVRRRLVKLIRSKQGSLEPLIRKLVTNEPVAREEIVAMVQNPSIRLQVYRLLESYNRVDLFPSDYLTQEKAAESFMVNWLEFPTELGCAPDEILFRRLVTITDGQDVGYYAFAFRTSQRGWDTRWLAGICGPYVAEAQPYDTPEKVFSRFKAVEDVRLEEEVRWVHENIGRPLPASDGDHRKK